MAKRAKRKGHRKHTTLDVVEASLSLQGMRPVIYRRRKTKARAGGMGSLLDVQLGFLFKCQAF